MALGEQKPSIQALRWDDAEVGPTPHSSPAESGYGHPLWYFVRDTSLPSPAPRTPWGAHPS